MTLVSRNIRYLRRLHGLTQEEFSKKIGIKRSLLGAYEEERASPNLTNLVNMAKTFGLSVDDLITLDIRKIRESASVFPETNQELLQAIEANLQLLEKEENKEIDDEEEEIENTLTEEKTITPTVQKEVKEAKEVPKETKVDFEKPSENVHFHTKATENVAKKYPTIEDSLFSEAKTEKIAEGDVPLVNTSVYSSYLAHYEDDKFIHQLPRINMSLLDPQHEYRAFEMDEHFPQPKSIVIGKYVKNWHQLVNHQVYVLVSQKFGIVYAEIENLLATQNVLIAKTNVPDLPSFHIKPRDIFEVWQPVLWFSTQMPAVIDIQKQKIGGLIDELHQSWQNWSK